MKKRAFKKLSAILAVALIIAAIAPLSAQAMPGDTFTEGDFKFTVRMEASSGIQAEVWLTEYNGSDVDVVIPATATNSLGNTYAVTIVDKYIFANKPITSVIIPSTVEDIANDPFNGCSSLTNVTFEPGSRLQSIGIRAFASCTSLVSINLPDGLKTIYDRVFGGCSSLESIDIPASVDTIYDNVFSGCSSLNEITFNSLNAPDVTGGIFDGVAPTGKIYYPENGVNYDEAFFNKLFGGSVPPGWRDDKPSAPSVSEPVNESAEVPEAEIPGFGRDFSVSGEITNAPGVPESVKLRVSSPSPEFTSNKAANAAYSDALLYGQPVAFNALEVVGAANGQAYALPEGAVVRLAFELGKAYADKAVTISQYDAAGELIERFNVTCDGDGAAVITANGLGLFVITREWI